MKEKVLDWKKYFDWKSQYYISSLIFLDFFGSIVFLSTKQFVVSPIVGPGVFELWLVIFSLLQKTKIFFFFAAVFSFIKPIMAICILKGKFVINYFVVILYIIELFAAICFIVTYRVSNTGLSFLLFLELFCVIFFGVIICLAIRTIKTRTNKDNQGTDD